MGALANPFSVSSIRRSDSSVPAALAAARNFSIWDFLAMPPRASWEPLPHEADLFCNVYIDESSQTKWRYLVLGALLVPLSHAAQFEATMIAARDAVIAPFRQDGTPRVIKWQKVNDYNLQAYVKVVNAYFTCENRLKLPTWKHIDICCLVIDTAKKSLKATGEGDVETGFAKEIYFLCVPMIGNRYKKELFHVYPDRRLIKDEEAMLRTAQNIMNNGARKYLHRQDWPYRRMYFGDPERCQALQVVDIFIGALAYKLNGHYDKPDANRAKKALCDYILRRANIKNPFQKTPYHQHRLSLMHRDGTKYVKKR
jgi:hypothetical protein